MLVKPIHICATVEERMQIVAAGCNYSVRVQKMSFLVKASLLFLLGAQCACSTALDEYVHAPDDNYKWVDMVCKRLMNCRGNEHLTVF
jgi:hypothetical protein